MNYFQCQVMLLFVLYIISPLFIFKGLWFAHKLKEKQRISRVVGLQLTARISGCFEKGAFFHVFFFSILQCVLVQTCSA